jgi:hypothetical protein
MWGESKYETHAHGKWQVRPQTESGDVIFASRASGKYNWHCSLYLQNDHAGWWIRTTGDEQETEENEIEPGHVPLGNDP